MSKREKRATDGDSSHASRLIGAARPSIRRLIPLLVPICALVAVISRLDRDRPERVPDPPPGYVSQGEICYSMEQKGTEIRLWSRRIFGGPPKLVGKMVVGSNQVLYSATPTIVANRAYCEIEERQIPNRSGGGMGQITTDTESQFMGLFLAPPGDSKHERGEIRKAFPAWTPRRLRKIELICAPLTGGGFEHVRLDTPNHTIAGIIWALTT